MTLSKQLLMLTTTNGVVAKLRNNLGQVVHTFVPLSPSSITYFILFQTLLVPAKGR